MLLGDDETDEDHACAVVSQIIGVLLLSGFCCVGLFRVTIFNLRFAGYLVHFALSRATLDTSAFAQSSHGLSAVIKMGEDPSLSKALCVARLRDRRIIRNHAPCRQWA